MSPDEYLRLARRLTAISMGLDELPADAEVEMSIDAAGNIHVAASVVADGYVPHIECKVKIG